MEKHSEDDAVVVVASSGNGEHGRRHRSYYYNNCPCGAPCPIPRRVETRRDECDNGNAPNTERQSRTRGIFTMRRRLAVCNDTVHALPILLNHQISIRCVRKAAKAWKTISVGALPCNRSPREQTIKLAVGMTNVLHDAEKMWKSVSPKLVAGISKRVALSSGNDLGNVRNHN